MRIVDRETGIDYPVGSVRDAINFLWDLEALRLDNRLPPPVHVSEVRYRRWRFRLREGVHARISAPFCGRCRRTQEGCRCDGTSAA